MKNLFDLQGKVAIITGASSGLGVQFAEVLADQGASVVLAARRQEKLEQVKETIQQAQGQAIAIQCDVTKTEDIEGVVQTTIEKFGKIDILVNNAGVANIVPAEQMTEEQWDLVLNTDLKSLFLFSRAVAKSMIEKKYGKIVNISSIFGAVGNSAFPVCNYHTAKHGVVGLTRALAAEWAKYNITVNAIGPGFFDSEMTHDNIQAQEFQTYVKTFCPMGRIGEPGELNGALLYLVSNASSYTTGQLLLVDGGWTAI